MWKDNNQTSYTSNSTGPIIVKDGEFYNNQQITTLTINGSVNTQDTTYTCEIISGDGGDPQPTTVYLYVFGKLMKFKVLNRVLWKLPQKI